MSFFQFLFVIYFISSLANGSKLLDIGKLQTQLAGKKVSQHNPIIKIFLNVKRHVVKLELSIILHYNIFYYIIFIINTATVNYYLTFIFRL